MNFEEDFEFEEEVETTSQEQPYDEHAYLIADCGHSRTTVSLFDVVGGSYHLIAATSVATTAAEPWTNITAGISQAVHRISKITGRTILNSRGELIRPARQDGTGVDFFTAVFSVAPPLNTFLIGLFDEVSVNSARRVLAGNYCSEVGFFTLSDTRSEEEQLRAFVQSKPDLIFIAGGTDGGASSRLLELVEIASLGLELLNGNENNNQKKIPVVYAGNKDLREQITSTLGTETAVHIADNVHPTLSVESLGSAIGTVSQIYSNQKIGTLPGIRELNEWKAFPFMPTAHAFGAIIEYLGALYQGHVVGVDVGSNTVTLVSAKPEQLHISIDSQLGMGKTVANLLGKVSLETISQWIPYEISEGELFNFVHNKALFPNSIPMNQRELYLEQAIARELIKQVVPDDLQHFKLLVARGSILAKAPNLGQTALMLLDAIQPTGIFSMVIDTHGILPALGSLAAFEPLVAVQTLEKGALTNLGWVIAPSGKANFGQKAVSIIIESEDVPKMEIDVDYGDLSLLPLAADRTAEVTIKPTRRFDIGFGPGKSKTVTLHGGQLGLIVDVRGRPLTLSRKELDSNQLMQQWLRTVGAT